MTNLPTAAEIAELIEFCRDELEARKRSDLEDEYIPSAEHARAIAERLPALIAERETIKAPERVSSAPAWAASIAMKIANWIRYDWESLQEQRIAEKGLPQWVNSGTYQGGQLDLIDLAMSIAAPLIAERDRLNEMLSHLGALAEAERDALVADRDRLAAEVERVKSDNASLNAIVGRLGDMSSNLDRAYRKLYDARETIAKLRETAHYANGTADLAMKHRDVAEASLAVARETIAMLREALEGAGRQIADGNTRIAMRTIHDALAQLDAPAEDDRRDAAVARALFRDAETGAAGGKVEDVPGHTDIMISPDAIDEALAETPQRHPAGIARDIRCALEKIAVIADTALAPHDNPALEEAISETKASIARAFRGAGASARTNDAIIAEAVEIMRPFAEFGTNVNSMGWITTIHREAVSNWFGPSLFRAAHAFVEKYGEPK